MDFISQMEINALEADIACYATAVYHEVNNRSLEEKLGVINVIRNRVKSVHDDSIMPKHSWFGYNKITHIGRMVFY